MRYSLIFIAILLCTLGKSQNLTSVIKFEMETEEFVSIKSFDKELFVGGAMEEKKIAMPVEIGFFNTPGSIDTLVFGLHTLNGKIHTSEGVFNISFFPFAYGPNQEYPLASSARYYYDLIEAPEKIAVFQYNIRFEGFQKETIFQVRFNETLQEVSYHYLDWPEHLSTDSSEFAVGIEYEDNLGGNYWIDYLVNNPDNPDLVKTIGEVTYLKGMPKDYSKYLFYNLTSMSGSEELMSKLMLEQTENGLRLFSKVDDLDLLLYDLNGRNIEMDVKQIGEYYFINPPKNNQVYILKVNIGAETVSYKIASK